MIKIEYEEKVRWDDNKWRWKIVSLMAGFIIFIFLGGFLFALADKGVRNFTALEILRGIVCIVLAIICCAVIDKLE